MKNTTFEIGKNVIDLQIAALKKLKREINSSFNDAVNEIIKCKSKVIICGVGKSGIIASKISATLSSVGTPSFTVSANDCSHGDMGRITKNDILILISNSGNTSELIDLIKYAKLNKITLICIVSKKNSKLYKSSNIKLLIPEAEEAGYGIVPTTSTTSQLSIGDALAIAVMKKKKFSKLDFKKFHPSGSLANKLRTAEDLMLTKKKIPFVTENQSLEKALEVLNSKKLGFIVIIDRNNHTKGVFTDGDLKRLVRKKKKIYNLRIKSVMTKNLFSVEKNTLASDILMKMNKKKITNVCVYSEENKKETIGILHIHDLIKIFK